MAAKKRDTLRGNLRGQTQPQPAIPIPQDITTPSSTIRGQGFTLSTMVAPDDLMLPASATQLDEPLRRVALRFIGARRRTGEALLESALAMQEARTLADEGTWYTFLQVVDESPDTAERLIRIALLAQREARFAAAITRGYIGRSVADLVARPSTPYEVLENVLAADRPIPVKEVQQSLKAYQPRQVREKSNNVDNPRIAGSSSAMQSHGAGEDPLPTPPESDTVEHATLVPPWVNQLVATALQLRTTLIQHDAKLVTLDISTAQMLLTELNQVTHAVQRAMQQLVHRADR